jgi:hypothetical protein
MSIEAVQAIDLTELVNLRIFKIDAIERMEDNERVLAHQRERIELLEYHLGKCRESAYNLCYATIGVLPIDYEPDGHRQKKPTKSKAKK